MIVTGQFNDSLPPILDGVAVTARNYAYWLNRNHAPSFAFGPRVPGYKNHEDFEIRYRSLRTRVVDPYRLGLPAVDRGFGRSIESIPFDLVHAHCPFISGWYALILARKRNIPLVTTFHTKYRDDFENIIRMSVMVNQVIHFMVRFYDHADEVWVPNEAIIETLREYGFKGPVQYVPNGSDIEPENGARKEKLAESGREFLGVTGDRPVLIYVGQHRKAKNLRFLVDSLAVARQNGSEFDVRFIGDGPDRAELQEQVAKLGLEERVRFMGAVHERERLRAIYAAAGLLVFPSLYDNASLVTREAAGFEVPTLFCEGATTAAGIQNGLDGFLAKDTPEEYGGLITTILRDSEMLRTAGIGARKTLYKSWEDIVDEVYDRYGEVVERYKWQQLRGLRPNRPAA